MRHIDNRNLKLPSGWKAKAINARTNVSSGLKKISDYSSVWTELKDELANLSNDKCWYCEAKQERSDDAVDHFRPKGSVAESPGHTGYTWLAFDETNYRYSCTFCNCRRKGQDDITKGKGDSFPLIDETQRAYTAGQELNENPKAIDPCKSGEPGWIDWLEDGKPTPKYPNNSLQNTKAACAIFLYHLDHEDACEARRSIAINLKSWIKQGHRAYLKFDTNEPDANTTWSERCQDIVKTMQADAPYSAFSRRIVMMLRSEYPWLDDLLQEN